MKGVESRIARRKREVSQARFRQLIHKEEGVSGGSSRPKGKVTELARLPSYRPTAGSEFQASQAAIALKRARFSEVLLDWGKGEVPEVQPVGRRGSDGTKKSAKLAATVEIASPWRCFASVGGSFLQSNYEHHLLLSNRITNTRYNSLIRQNYTHRKNVMKKGSWVTQSLRKIIVGLPRLYDPSEIHNESISLTEETKADN
ncbi:hypothetical protein Lser_V15G15174 [Lactuca serriola]